MKAHERTSEARTYPLDQGHAEVRVQVSPTQPEPGRVNRGGFLEEVTPKLR